ncbi:MAG: hypothetical protein OWS74_01760 [Firmicutes bacterium]|nr:hypothetical protein [Bacillota bacterium]
MNPSSHFDGSFPPPAISPAAIIPYLEIVPLSFHRGPQASAAPAYKILSVRNLEAALARYSSVRLIKIKQPAAAALSFDTLLGIIRRLRRHYPSIAIEALSASDLTSWHRLTHQTISFLLSALADSGVTCLGPDPRRIASYFFPRWHAIHRVAQEKGIQSVGQVMLSGAPHPDTVLSQIDHIAALPRVRQILLQPCPLRSANAVILRSPNLLHFLAALDHIHERFPPVAIAVSRSSLSSDAEELLFMHGLTTLIDRQGAIRP